jgi:hypothetical protein
MSPEDATIVQDIVALRVTLIWMSELLIWNMGSVSCGINLSLHSWQRWGNFGACCVRTNTEEGRRVGIRSTKDCEPEDCKMH